MSLYKISPERRVLLDLMRQKEGIGDAPKKRLEARLRGDEFPLSFAQSRLWFLNQLAPANPFYNVSAAIPLNTWLNIPKLEQSLKEIVRRHESLRTTFVIRDGEPIQLIAADPDLELVQIDLRHLPASARRSEVERLAAEEAQKPFDLAKGPLIRTILLHEDREKYVFLLTLHHIICDGWSLNLLTQELNELYAAFVLGKPASLPDLPIQYADYAQWQRDWLQGETYAAELSYWKAKLAGSSILQLKTDRPRPSMATFRGTHLDVAFPASLTAGIKQLGRQEGATLYMVLLAAFKVLLHRYTNQTDIIVGSPILGRNQVETENLIGFFVNTLVMRTDLSSNPSFRELLRRVRNTATEAYANQNLPFEKLVEEIQPERDLSRNPLFQVMFQFFSPVDAVKTESDGGASTMQISRGTSIFDLALHLSENDRGIYGQFEYSTELFNPETIQRLAGHFRVLLQSVTADPDQPISDLKLLTENERYTILTDWNRTEKRLEADRSVLGLFAEEVARNPNAVAVVSAERDTTYRELDDMSDRLACHLQNLGVGPESLVGIGLNRSIELTVALLSVLKSGAAYVPLDPAYPARRTAFILNDSSIGLVLTDTSVLARLPQPHPPAVCLDTQWNDIVGKTEVHPLPNPSPVHLAYIIYTSGSTGLPKGIAMSHRALTNLIHWQLERPSFQAGQTVLQYTSLSFDVSFQEILSTFCSGGKLVLTTEEERRDPSALWKIVRRTGVTRIFIPFVMLQQLAETRDGWIHPDIRLREVITAGEQLKITEAVRELFSHLAHCTLDNHYGPTESHVVTAGLLSGTPKDWPLVPPIGRPIANVQIYLLDALLRPVPVGVTGEIFIAGDALARGYVNRPGLTAERFLPNPFSPLPGARMYRTGDLARYLPDGAIAFLGRADHQVKLRGFRIEPAEIESVLGKHPAVKDCAIECRGENPRNRQLVAYVVPRPVNGGTTPLEPSREVADQWNTNLRRFLQEELPAFMIPTSFAYLESLPLTPNGKVDRKTLPDPNVGSAGPAVCEPPRTQLQKTLAKIWATVLGTDRIGIHDHFFNHLGGHSLLATKVIAMVRNVYRVDLPLSRVFEAPTVAEFAAVIEEALIDEMEALDERELLT